MRYAEAGYQLEIDLATGNVERVATDPKLTETLIGGLGACIKELWDRTGPDTKPFDPENPLIFSNGPPGRHPGLQCQPYPGLHPLPGDQPAGLSHGRRFLCSGAQGRGL